jgi:hypothetical protein
VLYAFAMHFNPLFLVYCATLGIASYALVGVALQLHRAQATRWLGPRPRLRVAGGFLIATGAAFAALWLSNIVPALWRGVELPGLDEVGLITNPVYVLDLAVVLPAFVVTGLAVLRRRPIGHVLAPMLLAFNTLMGLALVGMVLAMRVRALPSSLGVAVVMLAVAVTSLGLLVDVVRQVRRAAPSRRGSWIDDPRVLAR